MIEARREQEGESLIGSDDAGNDGKEADECRRWNSEQKPIGKDARCENNTEVSREQQTMPKAADRTGMRAREPNKRHAAEQHECEINQHNCLKERPLINELEEIIHRVSRDACSVAELVNMRLRASWGRMWGEYWVGVAGVNE